MKFIGNIIWLICGGLITAIEYLIASLLMMITIIGIPFGLQTLKLGILALWPFGSKVVESESAGGCLCIIMNIIWILVGGIWIAATHLFFVAYFGVSESAFIIRGIHSENNTLKWQVWHSLLLEKK